MSDAKICLIESDGVRADAMLDRLRTWFPDLAVDLAIGERDAMAWRTRHHGIVCDHDGAMALIEIAMEAEERDREVMWKITDVNGKIERLEKGQEIMGGKIDNLTHVIDGNGGPGIKTTVQKLDRAIYGDHENIDTKPGLIASMRLMGMDLRRIMWWGSLISGTIITGLIGIAVVQVFGK